MAGLQKLVQSSQSGVTIGNAGLGFRDGQVSSVKAAVHDGDTITARALANVSIRFLGVDTPEVSFTLPGEKIFRSIDSEAWREFLADPFSGWDGAASLLGTSLFEDLVGRLGSSAAENHAQHAEVAHRALEDELLADLDRYAGGDTVNYGMFLRYAREVIDRYGRLLAYANVDLPGTAATNRPLTYNERMLQSGLAVPYFIFPNIDPFKRQRGLLESVPGPSELEQQALGGSLGAARRWVAQARSNRVGVFRTDGPGRLQILPFELRFLAGRRAPDRWLVDMTAEDGKLLRPTAYHTVERVEDRLFVPEEYLLLFEAKGWRRT